MFKGRRVRFGESRRYREFFPGIPGQFRLEMKYFWRKTFLLQKKAFYLKSCWSCLKPFEHLNARSRLHWIQKLFELLLKTSALIKFTHDRLCNSAVWQHLNSFRKPYVSIKPQLFQWRATPARHSSVTLLHMQVAFRNSIWLEQTIAAWRRSNKKNSEGNLISVMVNFTVVSRNISQDKTKVFLSRQTRVNYGKVFFARNLAEKVFNFSFRILYD